MSSYAFISAEQIACTHIEQGVSTFGIIETRTGKLTTVDCPFTDIQYVRAHGGDVVFRGGSPTEVLSIVKYNVESKAFETLRRSNELESYPRYFSVPPKAA
jgi:hypothetical protein